MIIRIIRTTLPVDALLLGFKVNPDWSARLELFGKPNDEMRKGGKIQAGHESTGGRAPDANGSSKTETLIALRLLDGQFG